MKTPVKILITDDEADIALILKLHLEDQGYETAWAKDGETCLAMLAKDTYSLLLLDIRMPGMSGVEVLEKTRQSGCDTAVVMMTAHGSESLAVDCMKKGAQDYVAKPFDLNDLLQRVERAVENRITLLEKQRLEQEKDDFVSMLSHDLKNPITAVIGSIDIMREGRLGAINPEQAEYLQSAIDSCNEVVSMIDNLLDIHRFEAGRMPMKIRPENIHEIISSLTGRLTMLAQREEVKLTVQLGSDLPTMDVDRRALTRVIGNLLGNAFKFTPVDGEVKLSCHTISSSSVEELEIPPYAISQSPTLLDSDRLLCLSVKDTGSGIPEEDLESIFDRFVQSRQSSRAQGGAGLGLAFCKLAVQNLGGIIWVKSAIGSGSEFMILLPCKEFQA
ncbi:ATP-binding response regulator [Pelotalea chapellei]|uniref:histidine kinase n=1 Tax=Pelotalea chapellei TaxID=44671 RepID=A0ABS5U6M1_9BACT|nr:hybrid sensor histidine kinase/response regulator [Pelotalea chapellei]MBT1071317.1 response regulator [Pelotalea chapellei]